MVCVESCTWSGMNMHEVKSEVEVGELFVLVIMCVMFLYL